MRHTLRALILAMLLGIAFPAAAGDVTVTVGHGRLDPADVTITMGDTVTFHNVDLMPGGHSVVADDGSFASPGLGKDENWSHTFEKPGVFPYKLREHPTATGKVTVE